ncbi:MAG: hypothetical protein M3537_06340, partial [Chloroflexota bacterium]|nr:hypothetical protein [Chloroflexota bacterium]
MTSEPVCDAAWASGQIVELLTRKKRGRDSHVHPETRTTVERILERLNALGDGSGDDAARTAALPDVLRVHRWLDTPTQPSEEQAWALADALQSLWIRTANEEALDEEYTRRHGTPPNIGMSAERKRAWLRRNYTSLQRAGAHERARAALRAKYLRLAGVLLILLVVASGTIALIATKEYATISLCALAGAVGGALSGARTLRDSNRIQDTRSFQTWLWVQPIVGAAVGLFLYALLQSPVLALPGSDDGSVESQAAARIVYAFLAGFSEPWLLGVMDRLGRT